MQSDGLGDMHVSGRNRGIAEFDLTSIFATDEERSALAMVKSLDLAHNQLKEVTSLQPLVSLAKLDLSHNRICTLAGLPLGLVRLQLAHNGLTTLNGIAALPNLQELDVSHNKLTSLAGLSVASPLKLLKASNNRLSKVSHLDALGSLRVLELDANFISVADNLEFLSSLGSLQSASFRGCPVTEMNSYRQFVIQLCPSLVSLDGVPTDGTTVDPVKTNPSSDAVAHDSRGQSRRPSSVKPTTRKSDAQPSQEVPSSRGASGPTGQGRKMMSTLVARTLGTRTVPDVSPAGYRYDPNVDQSAYHGDGADLSTASIASKSDDRRRSLQTQVSTLERQLDNSRAETEQLLRENKTLASENRSLAQQLSDVRRVVSDELDEVATLRDENTMLRDEVAVLKTRLAKTQRESRYSQENAHRSLVKSQQAMEKDKVRLEHAVTLLQGEVDTLRHALGVAERRMRASKSAPRIPVDEPQGDWDESPRRDPNARSLQSEETPVAPTVGLVSSARRDELALPEQPQQLIEEVTSPGRSRSPAAATLASQLKEWMLSEMSRGDSAADEFVDDDGYGDHANVNATEMNFVGGASVSSPAADLSRARAASHLQEVPVQQLPDRPRRTFS